MAALRARSLVDHEADRSILIHPIIRGVVKADLAGEDGPLHLALHLLDAALTHSGRGLAIEDATPELIDHAVVVSRAAVEHGGSSLLRVG